MGVGMCEQFETNQCPSIFGLIYALIYIKYHVGRIHASDKVILNIINKSNQTQINTIKIMKKIFTALNFDKN
jgi:hypothetical protein